ncbi:MAG TPA: HAMP domain-containing sensor histidine kinase, partial [Candidatus Eisenbacteria bacterium]
MALQVGEAFERELMADLRRSITAAENAARNGDSHAQILQALAAGKGEFISPEIVPLDDLTGYSLLIVESQPLVYAPSSTPGSGSYFSGLLLRDPRGQIVGAGGWWFDPERYLAGHLAAVVQDRLPGNPRLYGGYESTRKLSVQLLGAGGEVIGRVRGDGNARTARIEPLSGPFERYSVRVAPTSIAPVVWATNFVALEITFIGLMGLAIVVAAAFGLRYTVRQLQLAQLKSGFVSNVTHELKTPIALIRLAVETLEMRRVNTPEEYQMFLGTIGRETMRLSQLVDNILDFARLEAGRRTFRFEIIDPLGVVRDAIETFRPRLEHQGFHLTLEMPESLPPVRGDAIALSHCLLNLLDNAVKYSKAQRELKVAAGTRGDEVAISVSDRGIGIAPEDQKRVFEKFVRLETGLVHDVKGAGLGLSLVDQIVRAHEGRVEVQSRLGEGSTFTIVLPVAGRAEESPSEPRRKTGS